MTTYGADGLPFGLDSQQIYLDPTRGSAGAGGAAIDNAVNSLATALARTSANRNDVVRYIPGSSGVTLSAALDWNKNYTHLVGEGPLIPIASRNRFFQLSTLTGASPLVTISASGCLFRNLYFFQGVADATSLINVSVTGGRNRFEFVHFAGGGHATQAVDGGASLKLDGAEENYFYACTIGVDTIDAGSGMSGLLFDGEAHRNTFENCTIRIRAGNAAANWVEVADATGIDRDNTFINCRFINNSATALTSGFVIPAGMGAPRKILLQNCMTLGATKLDANDRGVLYGNMNAVTGADLSGAAVELIS